MVRRNCFVVVLFSLAISLSFSVGALASDEAEQTLSLEVLEVLEIELDVPEVLVSVVAGEDVEVSGGSLLYRASTSKTYQIFASLDQLPSGITVEVKFDPTWSEGDPGYSSPARDFVELDHVTPKAVWSNITANTGAERESDIIYRISADASRGGDNEVVLVTYTLMEDI